MFTVVVVALTLAGFAAASAAGVNPAWAAFAGAVVLAVRALARRRGYLLSLVRAADLPFLLFVLSLGIVGQGGHGRRARPGAGAAAARRDIAARAARHEPRWPPPWPTSADDLPAVLVLLPLGRAVRRRRRCWPVLLGVNIGPNLTYARVAGRPALAPHPAGATGRRLIAADSPG